MAQPKKSTWKGESRIFGEVSVWTECKKSLSELLNANVAQCRDATRSVAQKHKLSMLEFGDESLCNTMELVTDSIGRELYSKGDSSGLSVLGTFLFPENPMKQMEFGACVRGGKYRMNRFCGKCHLEQSGPTFQQCGKCKGIVYCSRDCQIADWKLRHKRECEEWQKERETKLHAQPLPKKK